MNRSGGPLQRMFVGEIYPTNKYGNVKIVEYNGTNDIIVEFEDGTRRKSSVTAVKLKSVKNNFQPCIYGVGYLGSYEYENVGNIKRMPEYVAWVSMLRRCYDPTHTGGVAYYGKSFVVDEWKNFSTYSKWYRAQKGYGNAWHVDKDLKVLGNKLYAPKFCTLVPLEVNTLLLKREALRGEHPLGVHLHKPTNKFCAQCQTNGGPTYIGLYCTVEEAFAAYKRVKEDFIKKTANLHRDILDPQVYYNLMNYEVKITD